MRTLGAQDAQHLKSLIVEDVLWTTKMLFMSELRRTPVSQRTRGTRRKPYLLAQFLEFLVKILWALASTLRRNVLPSYGHNSGALTTFTPTTA